MNMNSDALVCPDWVWLNNSNVHVAKDRAWFKTYTPFVSTVEDSIFTSSPGHLGVLGIGSVEIPTKRSPNRSGKASHGTLFLEQVLHVPEFICNVLGGLTGESDGYLVHLGNNLTTRGMIKNRQGNNLAYFDPNRPLCTIKVRNQPGGPKLGPRVLEHGTMYILSCRWGSIQRQRWLEYQAQNASNHLGSEWRRGSYTNPPYTDAERDFIKKNWGSEHYFLIVHGLKIFNEEDREEGRSILRALMEESD